MGSLLAVTGSSLTLSPNLPVQSPAPLLTLLLHSSSNFCSESTSERSRQISSCSALCSLEFTSSIWALWSCLLLWCSIYEKKEDTGEKLWQGEEADTGPREDLHCYNPGISISASSSPCVFLMSRLKRTGLLTRS